MASIMNGIDGQNILPQFEKFRQSDEERQSLIQDVVKQYEKLRVAFQEKCDDYENEVQSRRFWQSQCEVVRREQFNMRQGLFDEALLKAGKEGGAEAAYRLLTEIKKYMCERFEGAGSWAIMVQIYVNLEGLGRKLAAIGITSPMDLHAFTRAFSLNQPLFSIVDVGSGKERADHKLREIFRLFNTNVQCKHILFGATHDNGYLPNLEPFKRDIDAAQRITLLESFSTQQGFKDLGFALVRFDSIFRSSPLPEKPIPLTTNTPQSIATPVAKRPLERHVSSDNSASGISDQTAPPLSTTPTSWATVGKSGRTEKNINIAAPKFVPRNLIALNADEERVDAQLARAEKTVYDRLNDRSQIKKFCNEHHLNGRCNSQYCQYEHGERLSNVEQLALRWKARHRGCQLGSACRSFDCVWGHQCINEAAGFNCSYGDKCHFAKMHGKNTTPAYKIYEDGTIETYA
ncbi:MAG: hypothetical protein M1820_010078 [Bogoriella megaspora]|nr:MAG: hypothetical protein M1820_010078 [Bogoriella megaspora]